METVEELVTFLERALDGRARDRVLDKGEAWSIMRRNGVPPPRMRFSPTLDADLAEYGFALLDAGLTLHDLNPGHALARRAFATAGRTFESLVRNGAPADPRRGFHRVMAAASYHLGSYAAIAYALFRPVDASEQNLNTAEACLVKLMLRDLGGVQATAREWLREEAHQDRAIATRLRGEDDGSGDGENGVSGRTAEVQVADRDDGRDGEIARVLISCVCRSLASYEFALRTGEARFAEESRAILAHGLGLAAETGTVSLWWVIRVTLALLDDLWSQSLHVVLPRRAPAGAAESYASMRTLFVASLFARDIAEVELWPSQVEAAQRATDPNDDLVVALPTSAGKTRIAELATLTALAMRKRVLVVTPLRALSAQSERSFRARFAPLGAAVSSLYGASGLSAGDEGALRKHDIVVATPEKLDFALRSDPTIIADVGLIVLDEGHLIGPEEREIHYEVLVQRLLRRPDAIGRRIVCLSAILPDGPEMDDLTAWIRSDEAGTPIRSDWRPTRQRFGTLEWRGRSGRLNYDLQVGGPFVPRFVREMPARGREQKPYPRALKDVVLMSAWRFARDGKRTLIFATQANWVETYGKRVVELVGKGYLPSLLAKPEVVKTAVAIGAEWLGAGHPAVQCLRYGVAVHHGKLPKPFLRELERLLASGVIQVTIASPTLAQGLNLNAAVLLIPYLVRKRKPILGAELANVAGRAGRAFVDTEGLILHVIHDKHRFRRNQWRDLVNKMRERSLTSGLITVIQDVFDRLVKRGIHKDGDYEYLANAREAWKEDAVDPDVEPLEDLVAKLDTVVLGLVEALEADADDLPELLEAALSGSLWHRQLARREPLKRQTQKRFLTARARLIWNHTTARQRRGHFAMGVGLESGLDIDQMADQLAGDFDRANLAALQGNEDDLVTALLRLAEPLLAIRPFAPDTLDRDWTVVLRQWIGGTSLSVIGPEQVELIEDVFTYSLVWALEAVRVRREAHGWTPEAGAILGSAAACVDTGLPDYRMALLVRGGLASRKAAQHVVRELDPPFHSSSDMRYWLAGQDVARLSQQEDWPSPSTAPLWRRFREEVLSGKERAWEISSATTDLSEVHDDALHDGALVRLEPDLAGGGTWLTGADFRRAGRVTETLEVSPHSVTYAEVDLAERKARIQRIGPRPAG